MLSIFEMDGGFWVDPGNEDDPFLLHQRNCFLNLHRLEKYMDRFSINNLMDDEFYYVWWRVDTDPELFDRMENVALTVGSVLLRDTPESDVQAMFDENHHLTEEDFNKLLETSE